MDKWFRLSGSSIDQSCTPRRRRGLVFTGCSRATLDYEPERAGLSTFADAQASQLQTNRAITGGFAPISRQRWEGRGASAACSSCGRYRYALSRDLGASGQGVALFVMLNPSTADARRDDPTIRRSRVLARELGFATLWVAIPSSRFGPRISGGFAHTRVRSVRTTTAGSAS